jgi:hypothetical protein
MGRWGVVAGSRVAFEKVDLDEVWRYLGMVQDGDGNCEHMVEQLRLQVGEAAEALSRKKISLAGAIYLSNVVVMHSALYRLKLSSATDEQIDRIESPLQHRQLRRRHTPQLRTLMCSAVGIWDVDGIAGEMELVSSGSTSCRWHGKRGTLCSRR